MGSTLSYLASPAPKAHTDRLGSTDDGDEDDIRPAKRRKTSNTVNDSSDALYDTKAPRRKAFGHVTNESKRAASRQVDKLQAVPPLDFYRKSNSSSLGRPVTPGLRKPIVESRYSKTNIQNFLPEPAANFKKALRIDVTGIFPKHAQADMTLEFAGAYKSPLEIKCRCSVALFCAKNDEDPSALIRIQDYSEVHRASKTAILRTTISKGQVLRDLIVDPFILSAYEFCVTRKRTSKTGDCHFEFGLGDKYYVQVTLDPIGSQKFWPPFDINPPGESKSNGDELSGSSALMDQLRSGKVMRNELSLTCNMPSVLDPDRQVRSVDLKLVHSSAKLKVPYGLQIQTLWSLPSKYSEPQAPVPVISPVKSRSFPSEAVLESPGGVNTEHSPMRGSMRRRSNVPTYNLKTLSAQAQGKSPRTRKNSRPRSSQDPVNGTEPVVVAYSFGRAGAAELGIKQQTCVHGFVCPFCHLGEASIDDLRLHLHTNHTNFRFSLRRANSSRVGFFVEIAKLSPRSSPSDQTKTFQLGKSLTLFDLDKFLGGDQSWLKAREGPQHNHWPEHLNDHFHESSLSSSSHDSRHSSPNTPNDTDDLVDLVDAEILPARKPAPRKIFYVPKTSKPLFDTVSKKMLEPGEEIPESDDEKDESWLHQKHRDIINDFTDLTDEEKEYITRWNPYIVDTHLTSEISLVDTCKRFARANAAWMVERRSRVVEFGKQMETFIMRGVLEQACLDKCVDILKAAERRKKIAGKDAMQIEHAADKPLSLSKLRGFFDCICCEQVQPPDQIICRGLVS